MACSRAGSLGSVSPITLTKLRDPRYRRKVRLASTGLLTLAQIALLALLVRSDVIFDASMRIRGPSLGRLADQIRRHPEAADSLNLSGVYLIRGGEVNNIDVGSRNSVLWSAEINLTFFGYGGKDDHWSSGHEPVMTSQM